MSNDENGEAPERLHEAYPVKTVARMTGLTPDVIRAWERRYGVVAPKRGPRGARLYSGADVAHLRLLAILVGRGRAIGDVAAMEPDLLQRLAYETAAEKVVPSRRDEERINQIVTALGDYDAVEVERLLGESLMMLGVSQFLERIGAPLLVRIGDLWHSGDLSVAEEHVASSTIRNLFGGLIRLHMPRRSASLLLTSPAGERHEHGLSIVSLLCQQAGLAVAYAGVDLPSDEILVAARKARVAVVGLSVVSSENRARAVAEIGRVEAGLPAEVELWVGGRDAAEVTRALGKTRALVLQTQPAIEAEIARVAARHADAGSNPRWT
jgi:MerR family transcriptional regulator, light-induced transcriptional regulator